MSKRQVTAETTKQRIIEAARILFAKKGIAGVSIREIADMADINHALIIRYFGSKDGLAAEILKREVDYFVTMTNIQLRQINYDKSVIFTSMRAKILEILSMPEVAMNIAISAQIIVRAELDGYAPETIISPDNERLMSITTKTIKSLQTSDSLPDAQLSTLIVIGAMISMMILSPWLLSGVGLTKGEFDQKKEELADMLMNILIQSTGLQ